MYVIRELTFAEMMEAYGLTVLMNPNMQLSTYRTRLQAMVPNGFRMVGAFDGAQLVGVSGFWINTKLYCGKYLEPDNFVIHTDYRSAGLGKQLLDWMEATAHNEHCDTMILDAYVQNADAHRFYFREQYRIGGFHFIKWL